MTTTPIASPDWGNMLRVRAEVRVTGGQTVTGTLHLQRVAPLHDGIETPEEVLSRSEAFFAMTTDDGTRFMAKSQVLVVTVIDPLPLPDPERLSAARTIGLRIEMSDGQAFSGTVSSELPPNRARALDYLNLGQGFFGLQSPEAVHYVNRCHVRIVTPLD